MGRNILDTSIINCGRDLECDVLQTVECIHQKNIKKLGLFYK